MVSIKGLEVFGRHFREFQDRYVLIGGVASALAMEDAGESFRTTKDIDTGLLTGEVIKLPESIAADMALFVERVAAEDIDFKALRIRGDLQTNVGRIAESFGLQVTS